MMLQDTLAIAYRIHIRHHYVRRFASVQRARVDAQVDLAVLGDTSGEEALSL